jgi:hypothetical protein
MTIKLGTWFDTESLMKDVAFDLSRPRQCHSAAPDLALNRSPDKRFISNHGAFDLSGFADA